MSLRVALLVFLFAVLAAVGLTGCRAPAPSPDVERWTFARVCADACGAAGVRRLTGSECECFPVVCTIDRLEVVPTPRGPDGRIRRGGGR